MKPLRWITGGLGLLFLLAAIWNSRAAQKNLRVIQDPLSQPPMTFILPEGARPRHAAISADRPRSGGFQPGDARLCADPGARRVCDCTLGL